MGWNRCVAVWLSAHSVSGVEIEGCALPDASPYLSHNGPRSMPGNLREHQSPIQRPVPPTVIRSSLIVGMPTPTGTLWPSLPQVPMPSSSLRSLPTMETYFSASGPLPIRVASLHRAP